MEYGFLFIYLPLQLIRLANLLSIKKLMINNPNSLGGYYKLYV